MNVMFLKIENDLLMHPIRIGHVNNIRFSTGISRYTQSKSYMLSLTDCVREFQNNALWDTH